MPFPASAPGSTVRAVANHGARGPPTTIRGSTGRTPGRLRTPAITCLAPANASWPAARSRASTESDPCSTDCSQMPAPHPALCYRVQHSGRRHGLDGLAWAAGVSCSRDFPLPLRLINLAPPTTHIYSRSSSAQLTIFVPRLDDAHAHSLRYALYRTALFSLLLYSLFHSTNLEAKLITVAGRVHITQHQLTFSTNNSSRCVSPLVSSPSPPPPASLPRLPASRAPPPSPLPPP